MAALGGHRSARDTNWSMMGLYGISHPASNLKIGGQGKNVGLDTKIGQTLD